MGWLQRLYIRWHDRPDPAAVMQRRPVPVGRYDYDKAVAGAHKRGGKPILELIGRERSEEDDSCLSKVRHI
jgi:hypothetical protein